MKSVIYNIIALYTVIAMSSCKKDFLEAKPSTDLLLLRSMEDFKQLLNNTSILNVSSALPLASSDEYDVPDYATYQTFGRISQTLCIWQENLFEADPVVRSWNVPYTAVFYANSVLEALSDQTIKNTAEWEQIKGWALFVRGFAFYDLAQNFCKVYDEHTAELDMGIPLKLKSPIDELLPRASLKDTYNQIISDLQQASRMLKNDISREFKNQPSKAATYGLLSRIFLSTREYKKAEAYADSCLSLSNELIDYNTISATLTTPFLSSGIETLYLATQIADYFEIISTGTGAHSISDEILNLYEVNDLRRLIFFRTLANGSVVMKRGYERANVFTGLAVDEIYLIKAECAARRSDVGTALSYINDLLKNRYKTGSFHPIAMATPKEALDIVLNERRKELIRRGLRWSDLKRLNKEGANITLKRVLNGQVYTLPPNDPRYIFPIPNGEIKYSGLDQNER